MEARRLVNAYPEGCECLLERGSPKLSYAERIQRIHTGRGGVIRAETTLYPEVIPTVIHKVLRGLDSGGLAGDVKFPGQGASGGQRELECGQTGGLILPCHYKEGRCGESTPLDRLWGLKAKSFGTNEESLDIGLSRLLGREREGHGLLDEGGAPELGL